MLREALLAMSLGAMTAPSTEAPIEVYRICEDGKILGITITARQPGTYGIEASELVCKASSAVTT